MAICNGEQPEMLFYDTQLMRKHLAGCLEDKMMRHFFAKKRSISKLTKKQSCLMSTANAECLKKARG